MTRTYDLEERLIDFVIILDDILKQLPNARLANHLAGQMVRSGTSPALNYGEAQSAESQKDFIHKMKLILKELRETKISLKIIARKKYLDKKLVLTALNEDEELIAIFAKSIITAKSKL